MFNIRELIFVVVCITLCKSEMTEEMKDLMASLHKTCISSTGVGDDIVTRAQNGDFADDENLKCYMRCTLDEVGVIDDDGKVDVEGMIGMLPDEIKDSLGAVVRKCASTNVGANSCDTVFLMFKCTYAASPSLYFLP